MESIDFGWLWCVNLASSIIKKCTTLVGDVGNGWGSTCVPRGIWAIFVPSPKTALKHETALESKVLI